MKTILEIKFYQMMEYPYKIMKNLGSVCDKY